MNFFSLRIPLVLGIVIVGCNTNGKENKAEKTSTITVPVLQIEPQTVEVHREYVANIQAVRNVELHARVSGYLESVFFDEGEEVSAGKTLFQLNREEFQAQLSKAEAYLQNVVADAKGAELELVRVRLLVDKDIVAKTELDFANAKLTAAKAKIKEARSEIARATILLSRTSIKAPFKGFLDRIPHRVGSLISPGTLLTTISDTRMVFAYFSVSENEYLEYIRSKNKTDSKASAVELILADGTFFNQLGTIETIEGAFDEGTGSIAFRARFANPDKLLKHGSTGTIRLTTRVKNAILIPQKAAFEIQNKNFVYVLGKGNRIHVRSFVPDARVKEYYLVSSGLTGGEIVVTEGLQSLRDSMVVRPKRQKALQFASAEINIQSKK